MKTKTKKIKAWAIVGKDMNSKGCWWISAHTKKWGAEQEMKERDSDYLKVIPITITLKI